MRQILFMCVALSCVWYSALARSETGFTLNGFGTVGSTHVGDLSLVDAGGIPYGQYDKEFSLKTNTKYALQGKAEFSDRLSATVQILSRGEDDFEPDVEWAYVSLKASEHLKLRAGRMRRPIFKHSDHFDLGYAYSWVSPPLINYISLPLLYTPITAVDIYHQESFGRWVLSQQWYLGADTDSSTEPLSGEMITYHEQRPRGVAFDLSSDEMSFRLAYNRTKFELDIPSFGEITDNLTLLGFKPIADEVAVTSDKTEFFSFGAQFIQGDWTWGGEYSYATHRSNVLPELRSFYLSLERHFDTFSVFGGAGRQTLSYDEQFQNLIAGPANELLGSESAAQQFQGAALTQIADGVRDYYTAATTTRRSVFFGARFDLPNSMAVKLQYENLYRQEVDKGTSVLSLSLDFVF